MDVTDDRFRRLEERVDELLEEVGVLKGQMEFVRAHMEDQDGAQRRSFDWPGFGKFVAQVIAALFAGHVGSRMK